MSGKDICIFLVFTLAVLEKSWSQNNTVNYTIVTPLQNTTLISSTLQDTTLISSTLQTTTLISSTLQDTTTISSTFLDTTVGRTTLNVASETSTTFQVNSATLNGTNNLGCQNGVSIHGFCLCSYDWSGSICNIPNFCPEQRPTETNKFTFPKTVLGQFASSTDLCPMETQNAGIPKASALCNITTRTFDDPKILDCDLTLEKVFTKISEATLTEKINLASSTQILTSKPENLTAQKIENAVKIANILLSAVSSQESMDIAVSTVAVVSQLMNTNHLKFSHIDQEAISELTRTLQKVSVLENLNTFLVQPNLAVQSFKGTSPIQRVQLTLFKGQGDALLPDRIKLNSSKNVPEDSLPGNLHIPKDQVDLQINITFKEGFDKIVGFVLYDSDQFFQSQSFKSFLNTKIRVLSANLSEYQDMELQFAVTTSNDSTVDLYNFACVFWSYSKKDWSTEGCEKTESFSGHVQCSCKSNRHENRLNFAILMTYNTNYQYSEALHWISTTGCSLSLVGLAVTVVYQIGTRKSRGCSPTLLSVNICLSMTVFYLLFMFGINNPVKHVKEAISLAENEVPESDHKKYSDEGPCTIFTALIHYFLLATFTWNFLYGIHVFLLFKATISGPPPWFLKVSVAFGWGFPAIIVGISLGSTYRMDEPLGYRQEEFCWLASSNQKQQFDMRKPMFWAFLLPLVIMLISNTAILLHFSHNISKTNPALRSRKTPLRKKLLNSFSLAVMLGLTWVIGYILLITHDKTLNLILSIVFCVCNTTQGIQIFVLFTLRSILKSNPALLNAVNALDIGLHRRNFFLWKVKLPESKETYTPTNPDPVRPPHVIKESSRSLDVETADHISIREQCNE